MMSGVLLFGGGIGLIGPPRFAPNFHSQPGGAASALHIGELCGSFSMAHGKNVNAAQVPWLAVAHLAIDPQHCGPASADDHFLGLEPCVGIAGEPSALEIDHGDLSLYASAVRSGRSVL